mmetsp:Transcript_18708/g.41824  ORF Transcript_18708/g.41824 Transcript_18708/m.41824 type:complete len:522 (+) Transcript_18708:1954-3519(+)
MSSRVFSCSLRFSDSWSSSLSCTVCSWPSRSCSRSTSRECASVRSLASVLSAFTSSSSVVFADSCILNSWSHLAAAERASDSASCSSLCSPCCAFCACSDSWFSLAIAASRLARLALAASILDCIPSYCAALALVASSSARCAAICSSASLAEPAAAALRTSTSPSCARRLFIDASHFCLLISISRLRSSTWLRPRAVESTCVSISLDASLSVALRAPSLSCSEVNSLSSASRLSFIVSLASRSFSSMSFSPSISRSYVADDFSNSERSVSSSAATAFFSVISSSHWVRQRESCCAISTCSVFLLRISNCSRSICCRCELYTAVSRASASRFFDCSFCSSSFRFLEADFHAISVAAPPCSLPRDVACASAVRASTVRSASRTRECSSTCWSSCPFQCSALPRALFASTSARCISFCTVFAFVSCWSRSTRILFSSSSSAAFSSSAARAMEVQSSRHCNSSSDAGFLSGGGAPSSFGGSASSAVCASYSAMRRRSFSCIAIDHSAFHPSACICRMATSCMNI